VFAGGVPNHPSEDLVKEDRQHSRPEDGLIEIPDHPQEGGDDDREDGDEGGVLDGRRARPFFV